MATSHAASIVAGISRGAGASRREYNYPRRPSVRYRSGNERSDTEPRPQGSGPAISRYATIAIAALCAGGCPRRPPHTSISSARSGLSFPKLLPMPGPDSASRQAGLRLDRREAVLGKVIVPGNSAASLLYQRISDPDPNARMPLAESRRSLTPAQIALIKRWIDQGAPWREQWAFQPPVKAKSPVG